MLISNNSTIHRFIYDINTSVISLTLIYSYIAIHIQSHPNHKQTCHISSYIQTTCHNQINDKYNYLLPGLTWGIIIK